MFLFKNGKFHIASLTFTIPDGYTLDTIDSSEEYHGSMKMVSPDGRIILTVLPIFCGTGGQEIELDAEGHFRDKLVEHAEVFKTITSAAPIRRKNLTGFCAMYEAEGNRYYPDKQYYEELYEISCKAGELNFIEICVETTAEYGIRKATEDPDVVRFLAELDE